MYIFWYYLFWKEGGFLRYGYHRNSTREQHRDRGVAEITEYCKQNRLELERIYTDQQTGKNFNRPRFQVLKEDVRRSADELIITEVDRLGKEQGGLRLLFFVVLRWFAKMGIIP